MTRHVQVTRLRPERREDYLRLHRDVWPAVEERLQRSGVRDYSIHLSGDLLIGVFEYIGESFEDDMAAMGADPATREWWALTDPCQTPLPEAADGAIWADAPAIWRLS